MKDQDTPRAFEPGPESIETHRQVNPGRGRPSWSGSRFYSGLIAILVLTLVLALVPGATPDAGASHIDIGYLGPSFGGYSEERLPDDNPTAGSPQSKLWFNDGSWWGVLYGGPPPGAYRIHRLSNADQTWSNSGVLVDARLYSHADFLWDGSHLYVVTAAQPGSGNTNLDASLLRFSYNGGTYSLDPGFPVVLARVEMEAIVLDKDSTGMLWVTYTADNGQGGRSVYVTHTTGSDASWRAPYVLPVTGASNLSTYEISAVIAYDGRIGVMWSNQADSAIYFASHQDGTPDDQWTVSPAFQGPLATDVSMNLKSLSGDAAGRVFAALKTMGRGLFLLILNGNGNWSSHDVYTDADNTPTTGQSFPVVMIDDELRKPYVFTSSEIWEYIGDHNGTQISYKESSLDNISFAPGLGTTFIYNKFLSYGIQYPTSKKGSVSGTTGVVVLAGDYQLGEYWHNTIGLPTVPRPPRPTYSTMTFTVGASADDGRVRRTGSTFPPTGAASASASVEFSGPARSYSGGTYTDQVALLRFDTAALPDDATIAKAYLRTYPYWGSSADGRNLVAEYYNPDNWPINGADYTDSVEGTALSIPLASLGIIPGIPLTNLSSISKVGYTGLRLGIDGPAPTGTNKFDFFQWDSPTDPPPVLEVIYTTGGQGAPTSTPVPPTATSVPPTATPVPPTATPLPTSPPAQGELLTNGSFENGSAGWTLSAQARVRAEAAYEGSYGVRFAGQTASAIARQDLAVAGGAALTFRAAGRVVAANNTAGAGIVEFKVYYGSGTQLGYWRFDTLSGAPSDWRVFTGTVTIPGNTRKARVQVRVVNLDGTMDFDAFSLTGEGISQLAAVPATEATVPAAETAVPAPETGVPPTATEIPPTATSVPAAGAAVPPEATSVPPAATTEPSTSTPSGPTETAVPPTETAPTETPKPTPRGWGNRG